jgi:hypothetical protein
MEFRSKVLLRTKTTPLCAEERGWKGRIRRVEELLLKGSP